jgi:hypothetical protein
MRRVLRLLAAVPLMVVLVVGVVLLVLFATNPDPRESPGWTLMAPMPEPRGETTTAVLEDRLYVIGGLSGVVAGASATVSVYDPATDAWTDGPALPDPRHHAGSGDARRRDLPRRRRPERPRLVAGDEPLAPGCRRRSLDRSRADAGGPIRASARGARRPAVGGRWRGRIGRDARLRPAIDAWETRAPLPENRDHLGVVVVDGEIWAIAGRNGGVRTSSTSTTRPPTRGGRAEPCRRPRAAPPRRRSDGLVLVSGGEDPAPVGDGVFDRHWWLDARAADPTWRELPRPPLAIHGVEGAVIDGRYYVVGGATRAGGQSFVSWTDATQAFDLATLDR